MPDFNIEAVVTCVNYSDFLAFTLPTNKSLFNHITVVTSKEDKLTRKLCEYWDVMCVATDAFNTKDGEFCKGAGINEGLKTLKKDGWVVHLDSDMFLPPLFRKIVQRANLDPWCLYGIDRVMVRSFNDWINFITEPHVQQENGVFVHTPKFDMGVRVAPDSYNGYLPIGFFQLWHAGNTGIVRYPENHTGAGRGDMLFAKQWDRAHRHLIPEIIGYHLESEPGKMGINWEGRKTAKFGVTNPGESSVS